jgi:methionyl-tRNA formyltransferase
VDRRVRACTPAPGAWTTVDGDRLRVGPVRVAVDGPDLAPGQLAVERRRVLVGTATHPVVLGEVQPAGRRRMLATEWARGARLDERTVLR